MTDNNKSDEIDKSIDHEQRKLENLRELKRIIQDLEEKENTEVFVSDPLDSAGIDVNIKTNRPYDELVELSKHDPFLQGEAIGSSDIIYLPDEDMYKVNTCFRTDR